jgi:hypothetical protein
MERRGVVIGFPLSARKRIELLTERCPAFGAIAERLPPAAHPLRPTCERLLAKVFTRVLHLPDVTRDEASALLDHDASADDVATEELERLRSDPATEDRHALLAELWDGEVEPAHRRVTRYYAALVARLYRLEPHVLRERSA